MRCQLSLFWPERASQAPPCLPRLNGVGGDLHIIAGGVGVSRKPENQTNTLLPMPSSYIRAIVKHVLHERPLCSSCTFLSVIVDSVGGFGLHIRRWKLQEGLLETVRQLKCWSGQLISRCLLIQVLSPAFFGILSQGNVIRLKFHERAGISRKTGGTILYSATQAGGRL
jgi:hypothetical protein